jgi:hypothetical protein
MVIVVVEKKNPQKWETVCTDKNCRAILRFDQTDIGYNSVYSMGREYNRFEGIVCPECNQVLKINDFKPLPDKEENHNE